MDDQDDALDAIAPPVTAALLAFSAEVIGGGPLEHGVVAAGVAALQSLFAARAQRNRRAILQTVAARQHEERVRRFLASTTGLELLAEAIEAAQRIRVEEHAAVLGAMVVGASQPGWEHPRDRLTSLLLRIVADLSYDEMRTLARLWQRSGANKGSRNSFVNVQELSTETGFPPNLVVAYCARLTGTGLVEPRPPSLKVTLHGEVEGIDTSSEYWPTAMCRELCALMQDGNVTIE